MAENKTKPEKQSATAFLNTIEDETKRADSKVILKLMQDITGEKPVMWGTAIIGFGHSHYTYESGREGDWFRMGFSPRKANLTLYLMGGLSLYEKHLEKLGKYKTGKGCLYINKLEQVDMKVLTDMIKQANAKSLKK
jgi:hypothetical protein